MDNQDVEAIKGATILQAAEKAGISIPTLYHHRDFIATGACWICVIEIEGSNRLVGSCHTPIAKDMALHTRSPKVISARKATVEGIAAMANAQPMERNGYMVQIAKVLVKRTILACASNRQSSSVKRPS